jgi:hypothetical protein
MIAASIPPLAIGFLVVGLVLGFVGYRVARVFRNHHGVAPWGAPPVLWGVLFAFSWLIGLVLFLVARNSTERDIERQTGKSVPGISSGARSRRGRIVAAVILFLLGVSGLVGGTIGLALSGHTNLEGMTVSTPATGMIATSIGAGGSKPTTVLAGAHGGEGIKRTGVVPTTPFLFLLPTTTTEFGVTTGSESAYWKVWWDGASQLEDVVSLQEHLDAGDASQGASQLDIRNNSTANFNGSDLSFTSLSVFTVPGVPGSSGHVWNGLVGGKLPIQLRFVVFSRGIQSGP